MTRAQLMTWSLVPSLLALAACTDPVETGHAQQAVGGCPMWGCTGNSPVIGPYELHELDLAGAANAEGVSLDGITLANAHVDVAFKGGDRIYAIDHNNNTIEGAGLNGLTFHLHSPTDDFVLVVTQVTPKATSSTRFWLGTPDRVETYELKFGYANHVGDLRPVCRNPPGAETAPGGEQWPNRFEAVLFTGDRYDGKKKVVTAASYEESRNWFNIGCAGSVLAKLHLNRHTTAGSDQDHKTHREERQALLKMYTGDFCGEGHASPSRARRCTGPTRSAGGSSPAPRSASRRGGTSTARCASPSIGWARPTTTT